MGKLVLGAVAGLLAWALIGFVCLFALQLAWADYASAIEEFAFNVPMLLARLVAGFLSSFVAGYAAYAVSQNIKLVIGLGTLIFVYACYMHFVVLWVNFPAWFHISYVATLLPLVFLGGYVQQYRLRKNA